MSSSHEDFMFFFIQILLKIKNICFFNMIDWLYVDYIQIIFRLYVDYIQIIFRLYLDYIISHQSSTQLRPVNLLHDHVLRDHNTCVTGTTFGDGEVCNSQKVSVQLVPITMVYNYGYNNWDSGIIYHNRDLITMVYGWC